MSKPYLDGTHQDAVKQSVLALLRTVEAVETRLLERLEFLEKRIAVLERKGSFVDARAVIPTIPPGGLRGVSTLQGHNDLHDMQRDHEDDLRGHPRYRA